MPIKSAWQAITPFVQAKTAGYADVLQAKLQAKQIAYEREQREKAARQKAMQSEIERSDALIPKFTEQGFSPEQIAVGFRPGEPIDVQAMGKPKPKAVRDYEANREVFELMGLSPGEYKTIVDSGEFEKLGLDTHESLVAYGQYLTRAETKSAHSETKRHNLVTEGIDRTRATAAGKKPDKKAYLQDPTAFALKTAMDRKKSEIDEVVSELAVTTITPERRQKLTQKYYDVSRAYSRLDYAYSIMENAPLGEGVQRLRTLFPEGIVETVPLPGNYWIPTGQAPDTTPPPVPQFNPAAQAPDTVRPLPQSQRGNPPMFVPPFALQLAYKDLVTAVQAARDTTEADSILNAKLNAMPPEWQAEILRMARGQR